MGYTRSRVKNKWNEANYERIGVTFKPGERAVVAAHAEQQGKSMNEYITGLIEKDMAVNGPGPQVQRERGKGREYDRYRVVLPIGQKASVAERAKAVGRSMSSYIIALIDDDMQQGDT